MHSLDDGQAMTERSHSRSRRGAVAMNMEGGAYKA